VTAAAPLRVQAAGESACGGGRVAPKSIHEAQVVKIPAESDADVRP